MKIVSWQVSLTEHQVHLLRALGKALGKNLKVATICEELEERRAQGWIKPDLSNLDVILLNSCNWPLVGISLINQNPDSVHLFSGLWADKRLFLLLLYAVWKKRKVGLVTEPFGDTNDGYLADQIKIKGWFLAVVRPFLYGVAGKLLGKRVAPVFAISPKACNQFNRAGFLERNIYPFGYFVPIQQGGDRVSPIDHEGILRLIFVGALISRKGVDTIMRVAAFCYERNIPVMFDVYGPGNADLLLPYSNIQYHGIIPFGQAQKVIANYDALIVPSVYDGWGVVVNEALQQGVPVLVSKHAGASALVEKSGAGTLFDPERITELGKLIESLIKNRSIIDGWKRNAQAFSAVLAPEIAAAYLLECTEAYLHGANKPSCPWYSIDERTRLY